jgi:hypothetical protein
MLTIPLTRYRDHLLQMKSRWVTPMASSIRFDAHIQLSKSRARNAVNHPEHQDVQWIFEPKQDGRPTAGAVAAGTLLIETTNEEDPLEDYPPSNEAEDLLLAEAIQLSEDAEINEDTSEIEYNTQDLSLIWEAPVRNVFLFFLSSCLLVL